MGREENLNFAENAIGEVEDSSLKEMADTFEIIADTIVDPELVHYSIVKDAYEKENHSVVVILLSTFFESFITEQLKIALMYIQAERETKGCTDFLEDANFEKKLKLARILGVLDDNKFDIINKVRKSRNKFSHSIESYGVSKQNEILEEVRLKDAFELYKKFSGASKS